MAYRIDTSIVDPLGNLPPAIAVPPPASLAERNLLRGWRMRLPSRQSIARAMGIAPLEDAEILIGKFDTANPQDVVSIDTIAAGAFAGKCPLWTYVLAETVAVDESIETSKGLKTLKTRKLGLVGGRIVAETIVGLLYYDSQSFLLQDPLWTPSLAMNDQFGLRELIATALSA